MLPEVCPWLVRKVAAHSFAPGLATLEREESSLVETLDVLSLGLARPLHGVSSVEDLFRWILLATRRYLPPSTRIKALQDVRHHTSITVPEPLDLVVVPQQGLDHHDANPITQTQTDVDRGTALHAHKMPPRPHAWPNILSHADAHNAPVSGSCGDLQSSSAPCPTQSMRASPSIARLFTNEAELLSKTPRFPDDPARTGHAAYFIHADLQYLPRATHRDSFINGTKKQWRSPACTAKQHRHEAAQRRERAKTVPVQPAKPKASSRGGGDDHPGIDRGSHGSHEARQEYVMPRLGTSGTETTGFPARRIQHRDQQLTKIMHGGCASYKARTGTGTCLDGDDETALLLRAAGASGHSSTGSRTVSVPGMIIGDGLDGATESPTEKPLSLLPKPASEMLDVLWVHGVMQAFFIETLMEKKAHLFWLESAVTVFCSACEDAGVRIHKDPKGGLTDAFLLLFFWYSICSNVVLVRVCTSVNMEISKRNGEQRPSWSLKASSFPYCT
ncbi:hypothetical protein MAPG_10429 [Magnaporthiopsis poae ATCC 64411]|uniref:Uncharacterized protein n=1 Tax=Magnaporthiopsis poae (strain ATCC 64411 / 73-15) TaxID=644358 RepID=A0A0C4ECK0_MAGP6|nr:hypothetical protein MAPG_10429 [Magnaporthiopsis poae ATCC 64411]